MSPDEAKIIEISRQYKRQQRERQEQLSQLTVETPQEPQPPADAPVSRGSSISSARKGRPTNAKDSDVTVEPTVASAAPEPQAPQSDSIELVGDFRQLIGDWQERMNQPRTYWTAGDYKLQRDRMRREMLVPEADDWPDVFLLGVMPLGQGETTQITLDEFGCIPQGTRVPRVEPLVYAWGIGCQTQGRNVTGDTWVRLEGRGPLDIARLTPLTHDELQAAMKRVDEIEAERNAPPPPPPEPIYQRQPRIVGDACSYLGTTIGLAETDVTISNRWAFHCFSLPSPQMIGSISAAVRTDYDESKLRLRLYDAFGQLVLKTCLRRTGNGVMSVRFDSVRLQAGDYLLAFDSNSHLHGLGSYKNPRCGLFTGALPDAPRLDDLLKLPAEIDIMTHQPIPCGMPSFRLSAD